MRSYESVCDYLDNAQPSDPVVCHRPFTAARAARWFLERFPGDVLYAVKANPSPLIIQALYDAGIRHFDVSSPAEVELVRSLFSDVRIYCMNPVKHPAHIEAMYFQHGVRDFALDTQLELDKIVTVTGGADDLNLHVRIAVDNSRSRLPLASKYGVPAAEAAGFLVAARLRAHRLGICFHVGSQAMQTAAYTRAIERANRLIRRSGVIIDSLDVGGGFPAAYPGLTPPPMADFVQEIGRAFEASLTGMNCSLLCEPGRALVAESSSLLVNVTLRKGSSLYINDGAYGALFDAAHINFPYPVRAIRDGQLHNSHNQLPFQFYGPTCDSIDFIPGPFVLPADMRAGDYLEIGQLGAYGDAMRTSFNGFGRRQEIVVRDEPMMSLLGVDEDARVAAQLQAGD